MLPFNIGVGGASGVDVGDIGHSLRLRSAASAYLSRTFGTGAAATKQWVSLWIKRGTLGTSQLLWGSADASTRYDQMYFAADDKLYIDHNSASSLFGQLVTSRVFRDPTAWIHIFYQHDSTDATAANRMRLWINGVEETSFSSRTNIASQNSTLASWMTSTTDAHNIGRNPRTATNYCDLYIARFAAGQGTSPGVSSFGYFNTEINEWVSKSQSAVKAVVDAGGANSFMLDFDNATSLTTLGYDKSSKGNNWTLHNVSLTAGTSYDWMLDVPGNSYCTLNPLNLPSNTALSGGNIDVVGTSAAYRFMQSTMLLTTGKWYFEMLKTTATQSVNGLALVLPTITRDTATPVTAGVYAVSDASTNQINSYTNGAAGVLVSTTNWGNNDVIQCAYDADTGKIWFGRNGSWYPATNGGTIGDPAAGTNQTVTGVSGLVPASLNFSTSSNSSMNFGQRPFAYTPPTGFKALCQRNLPDPAILNPEKQFEAKTRTGTGAAGSVSGLLFAPGLVWSKSRSNLQDHELYDIVRGATKYLLSDTTSAEGTAVQGLTAFNSDGFSFGNSSGSAINISGQSIIDWLWKMGGASLLQNNLVTNTSDFSSYGLFGGVVTANTDVAPDGTTTADTINDNTPSVFGGVYSQQQIPLTQNRRITCSVYIKKDAVGKATRYPSIRITTSSAGYYADTYLDTSTGETYAHGNLSGVSGGKTDAGSYWLVYVSAYDPAADVAWARCDIFPSIGANASLSSGISTTVTGSIVAWGLKAEYDSSISSQVSANVGAGFSIVTYTGTGANATVGHGLGVAPKLIIAKRRTTSGGYWVVYTAVRGAGEYMYLNTTQASTANTVVWQGVEPTSSVFSLGTGTDANTNGEPNVAYCFAEIPGFSKIFSYTGNGSTDGPFVPLGFKPKFILIKSTAYGQWEIFDGVRDPYNANNHLLIPSSSAAEEANNFQNDFLSNGFKPRLGAGYGFNDNGVTYVGIAFADVTGKYSLAR